MAQIQTYSFTQLVQQWVTAAQSAAKSLLDFSVGSVLLAAAEACSGLLLWLQGLALTILGLTRFATSFGADADSWGADFNFARLPAVAATGNVTFSRASPSSQAVIPAGTNGAVVQTGDGTQGFIVTVDTTNPAYSASLGGYVLPISTSSVTVPVQAQVAGAGGNVQANTITTIVNAIPGVDSVTNSATFTTGVNAESDTAYKARFPLFLAGLASADLAAIESAIANVQQGIRYLPIENVDWPGLGTDNGNFVIVADTGVAGSLPANVQTLLQNAINAARAFGIRFQVAATSAVTVNVVMSITTAAGYTHGSVVQQVEAALAAAINALPLTTTLLPLTQLASIAYGVAGVTNVPLGSITINGVAADLALTQGQGALAGTMNVS